MFASTFHYIAFSVAGFCEAARRGSTDIRADAENAAAADLDKARRDLIETLLERGYPVPLPAEQIAAQAA